MSSRNDYVDYKTIAVAGSSNMTPLYNIYYFAATNPIVYTYNLPPITCDGMKFKIVRSDKLVTATLTIAAVNNINNAGSISTSMNISTSSIIIFISFNSIWYVSNMGTPTPSIGRIIFSGTYGSNSGYYHTFARPSFGGDILMAAFEYQGSSVELITGGVFIVHKLSNSTIKLYLRNSSGTVTIANVNTSVPAGVTPIYFNSINQALLPAGLSVLTLFIYIGGGGGTNNVGISSFLIY